MYIFKTTNIAQIFASAQGNGRKGMGRHGVIFIMGS